MKKIIISLQGEGFTLSDLKYENELKPNKTRDEIKAQYGVSDDQAYLILRNSMSSYNTYSIIDIVVTSEDEAKCIFMFDNYEKWDKNIFDAGKFFKKNFNQNPA